MSDCTNHYNKINEYKELLDSYDSNKLPDTFEREMGALIAYINSNLYYYVNVANDIKAK